MWQWVCNLFGFKSKPQELPASVTETPSEHPYRVAANVNGSTPPVLMDEVETDWSLLEQPLKFIHEKPNLHSVLAKVRQEALDPVLPESLKEAVEIGVNTVLPLVFKKALITKEDLILFGSTDINSILKKRISDDDWNIIKCFIIKRLNGEGIKASNSSSGDFVLCHCKDILESIKDYK